MRVLVLGGTNFLGPHIVGELLDGGHEVTVFNRGRSPDTLAPQVERLRGDRTNGDLETLRGRAFDATVDLSAYFPRAVEEVLEALGEPGFYCFVSTMSVYAGFEETDQNEAAPLAQLDDPTTEDIGGGAYGGLKVLCEEVVRRTCAEHAVLRPGLVIGPGDPTDRFTYWVDRVTRGGTMVAPGDPQDFMQWIDVRDLARFARQVVEERVAGTFNVATPARSATIGSVLATIQRLTDADVNLAWTSAEQLAAHGLEPWSDLPAWLPSHGATGGFATFDTRAAREAGLETRPVAASMTDLLEWWASLDDARREPRAGLASAQEGEVLAATAEGTALLSFGAGGREGDVDALLAASFDGDDEIRLVRMLREADVETFEILATAGGQVVGHVMFSSLRAEPAEVDCWALAPMAVAPAHQRAGIGKLLGKLGLEACRARGGEVVCVLGHPDYYPRLGFSARDGERVSSPYSSAGKAWMALELSDGALDDVRSVEYAPPFSALE